MIINNDYSMTHTDIGTKLYETILKTICKDISKCKKKKDINQKGKGMLQITIGENELDSGKQNNVSTTLKIESSEFFNINSQSEIAHNVQVIYDTDTDMINVDHVY